MLKFLYFLDYSYKFFQMCAAIGLILCAGFFYRLDRDEQRALEAGEKAFWECHDPGNPKWNLPKCAPVDDNEEVIRND